ncbi:MAG: tRNA (adenosine(37)-N6)-threonylcarbamoyltransferase complex ATPase subunit type 1 TsaE [Candidatus Wildermuthbacteria bacterium]|nr:tRNA (adenosine(37)-N6)-threonylcarbamoyltransferase complex ATPase subunit type 1 TsaE [Candidatus Wildermuthbacteria bacterium]
MKKSIISSSPSQTKNIAKALAETLLEARSRKEAMVLALAGELGAGKTTFAQGFAKGLGVKEKILSPTFILLREFKIKHPFFRTLYHVDCYRLDNPARELLHLGFKKIIADPRAIVVIEWADRIQKILPRDFFWIQFRYGDKNKRSITLH